MAKMRKSYRASVTKQPYYRRCRRTLSRTLAVAVSHCDATCVGGVSSLDRESRLSQYGRPRYELHSAMIADEILTVMAAIRAAYKPLALE